MRIQNDDTDELIRAVWLYLSSREASDLVEALELRLAEMPDETDRGWHHHIDSRDGSEELTVAVYDEGSPPDFPSD